MKESNEDEGRTWGLSVEEVREDDEDEVRFGKDEDDEQISRRKCERGLGFWRQFTLLPFFLYDYL